MIRSINALARTTLKSMLYCNNVRIFGFNNRRNQKSMFDEGEKGEKMDEDRYKNSRMNMNRPKNNDRPYKNYESRGKNEPDRYKKMSRDLDLNEESHDEKPKHFESRERKDRNYRMPMTKTIRGNEREEEFNPRFNKNQKKFEDRVSSKLKEKVFDKGVNKRKPIPEGSEESSFDIGEDLDYEEPPKFKKDFKNAIHQKDVVPERSKPFKKEKQEEKVNDVLKSQIKLPASPQLGPYSIKITETTNKTMNWCSCGLSKKQPFCDDSHKGTEFSPIKFRVSNDERRVTLCGCKHTKDSPFCDGTCRSLKKTVNGTMPANPMTKESFKESTEELKKKAQELNEKLNRMENPAPEEVSIPKDFDRRQSKTIAKVKEEKLKKLKESLEKDSPISVDKEILKEPPKASHETIQKGNEELKQVSKTKVEDKVEKSEVSEKEIPSIDKKPNNTIQSENNEEKRGN